MVFINSCCSLAKQCYVMLGLIRVLKFFYYTQLHPSINLSGLCIWLSKDTSLYGVNR